MIAANISLVLDHIGPLLPQGRFAVETGQLYRRSDNEVAPSAESREGIPARRQADPHRLQSYAWPGNVRELQNIIERSVIVSDTDEFTVDESWLSAAPQAKSRLGLSSTLASHEKAMIEDALRESGGRVFGYSGAAARLGIPRSTLESKIRALKIKKSRFRTRTPKRS